MCAGELRTGRRHRAGHVPGGDRHSVDEAGVHVHNRVDVQQVRTSADGDILRSRHVAVAGRPVSVSVPQGAAGQPAVAGARFLLQYPAGQHRHYFCSVVPDSAAARLRVHQLYRFLHSALGYARRGLPY